LGANKTGGREKARPARVVANPNHFAAPSCTSFLFAPGQPHEPGGTDLKIFWVDGRFGVGPPKSTAAGGGFGSELNHSFQSLAVLTFAIRIGDFCFSTENNDEQSLQQHQSMHPNFAVIRLRPEFCFLNHCGSSLNHCQRSFCRRIGAESLGIQS